MTEYFTDLAQRLQVQFVLADVEEEAIAMRSKYNSKEPAMIFGVESTTLRDLLADDLRRHHTVHLVIVKDAPSDHVQKIEQAYNTAQSIFDEMIRMMRRDVRTRFDIAFVPEKANYRRVMRMPNLNSAGIYCVLEVLQRFPNPNPAPPA